MKSSIELKEIHKVLTMTEKAWLSAPHGHPVYDTSTPKPPEQNSRQSWLILI